MSLYNVYAMEYEKFFTEIKKFSGGKGKFNGRSFQRGNSKGQS